MTLNAPLIKTFAADLGQTLCGIASIDRFAQAPLGYHPQDVLPGCRSVIVIAKRFLNSTLSAASSIPYTITRNHLTHQMDQDTLKLAYFIENHGALAVPVGAIGPCNWNAETQKSMGLISLKHAAVCAGLGKMGKNTLLVNDRYGNMLWLGAVLTTAELQPDPLAAYTTCPPNCRLCLQACPVQALDGLSMNQLTCWNHAFGEQDGGEWRIKCYTCRKICPNALGLKTPNPFTKELSNSLQV
jgi:epoxyqueuosine reductase QueG